MEKEIFYFSAQKYPYDFKIEIIWAFSSTYSAGYSIFCFTHVITVFFSSTSWDLSVCYNSFTICISLNCIPKNVYSTSLISSNPIDAYILRATVFSNDTLIYSLSALCFSLK